MCVCGRWVCRVTNKRRVCPSSSSYITQSVWSHAVRHLSALPDLTAKKTTMPIINLVELFWYPAIICTPLPSVGPAAAAASKWARWDLTSVRAQCQMTGPPSVHLCVAGSPALNPLHYTNADAVAGVILNIMTAQNYVAWVVEGNVIFSVFVHISNGKSARISTYTMLHYLSSSCAIFLIFLISCAILLPLTNIIITLQLLPCDITFHHHVQYFSCAIRLTTTYQYHWQLVVPTDLTYICVFTFTFSRRFYPKRLTKSTIVEGEAAIYHCGTWR